MLLISAVSMSLPIGLTAGQITTRMYRHDA